MKMGYEGCAFRFQKLNLLKGNEGTIDLFIVRFYNKHMDCEEFLC